jgi:Ca-activated chloride channel family protein
MTIRFVFFLLLLLSSRTIANAQGVHQILQQANKKYLDQNYKEAETDYRKALEQDKNSLRANYNLGNAVYDQKKYEEAEQQYKSATSLATNPIEKAKAFHNLGNTQIQQKKYAEALESYKNALRANPNDVDTKYNYALAQRMLQQQQQQQQNQQNNNNQQQQQQQQNQQQNQKQPQDDKKQPQNQSNNNNQNDNNDQKTEDQPRDIGKEEAQRLLDVMDSEEQKVQEKMRKARSSKPKSQKDW